VWGKNSGKMVIRFPNRTLAACVQVAQGLLGSRNINAPRRETSMRAADVLRQRPPGVSARGPLSTCSNGVPARFLRPGKIYIAPPFPPGRRVASSIAHGWRREPSSPVESELFQKTEQPIRVADENISPAGSFTRVPQEGIKTIKTRENFFRKRQMEGATSKLKKFHVSG